MSAIEHCIGWCDEKAARDDAYEELATLRANQLSHAIVEAVKEYQAAWKKYPNLGDMREHCSFQEMMLIKSIIDDAKEREG